jgi:hypothetical protein
MSHRQYSMGFHTAKVSCPKARRIPGRPQNIFMEKTEERLKEEKTF